MTLLAKLNQANNTLLYHDLYRSNTRAMISKLKKIQERVGEAVKGEQSPAVAPLVAALSPSTFPTTRTGALMQIRLIAKELQGLTKQLEAKEKSVSKIENPVK